MGKLDGRVAVVTGGGRGIGRAIAHALASEGARIVVSSRTSADLEAVVASARAMGTDGRAVVADATDRHSARLGVQTAVADFGRIDILVNNAGGSISGNHDPYSGDDEAFERTLAFNLTSAFWTSTEALPHMRSGGYGRIINIGSGSARHASSTVAYTTAKHALVGLTRSLAATTARDGITVNLLSPGWTNTTLIDWDRIAKGRGVSVDEAQEAAKSDSLQHRILEPEELAPMAVLLASPDGGGITGQMINVDGGYRV